RGCARDRNNWKRIWLTPGAVIRSFFCKVGTPEVHGKERPTTHSSSIRKTGARGGSRTHMRKNPRRILSPQRLPFRHPGIGNTNLTNRETEYNTAGSPAVRTKALVPDVVSAELSCGVSNRFTQSLPSQPSFWSRRSRFGR